MTMFSPHRRRIARRLPRAALLATLLAATAATAQVEPPPTFPIETPDHAREHGLEALKKAIQELGGVPVPNDLHRFIIDDHDAALVLGKALFWDMSVGSDGVEACASCHFHGGADNRTKNQLNPNITRFRDQRDGDVVGYHDAAGAEDDLFELVEGTPSTIGPNYDLERGDFPFVMEPNRYRRSGDVLGPRTPDNSNDVASSQGVFRTDYVSVTPGAAVDQGIRREDPIWQVDGANVRRVEPRNTPSVNNAVLNFHNFWDGRANNHFNGRNPFGSTDPSATIFEQRRGRIREKSVTLRDASLASQAVGPPQSFFEMSFGDGGANVRPWPDIGRKLLSAYALANQEVSSSDSVLGGYVAGSGVGLDVTYQELVERAFNSRYWDSSRSIEIDGTDYTMSEANFSFFFGIAVMVYEATLVMDETPFDQWMETGRFNDGFGQDELDGLNVFVGDGKCINCHGGPEFTNASVRNAQGGDNLIEPMQMGDGRNGIYDNGYYNIAVTLTTDDIGRGGKGPNGKPLASTRQALFQRLGIEKMGFPIIGNDAIPAVDELGNAVCDDVNLNGVCDEDETIRPEFRRAAVDGAFKTPTIRGTELTGPFFHNGGSATLMQVVEFYDRGGNFCEFNLKDLDPDIRHLGLTADQERDLVRFIMSTTDERVRYERAPFDHPELLIPNGHRDDEITISLRNVLQGIEEADDDLRRLPAVGSGGSRTPLQPFLGLNQLDAIRTPPERACNPVVAAVEPPPAEEVVEPVPVEEEPAPVEEEPAPVEEEPVKEEKPKRGKNR